MNQVQTSTTRSRPFQGVLSRSAYNVLSALAVLCLSLSLAQAEETLLLDGNSLSGWEETVFEGVKPTRFQSVHDQELGRSVLLVEADGSSSMWNLKRTLNLAKTPYLKIRWRIGEIGARKGSPDTKQGDDYPFRIYFHKAGFIPQTADSLQLVLSPVHKTGDIWESPYSSLQWGIMAYAIAGRDELKPGGWNETVLDLRDAWQAAWNDKAPEKIDGIGILGDADGTGTKSVVYIDSIRLADNP